MVVAMVDKKPIVSPCPGCKHDMKAHDKGGCLVVRCYCILPDGKPATVPLFSQSGKETLKDFDVQRAASYRAISLLVNSTLSGEIMNEYEFVVAMYNRENLTYIEALMTAKICGCLGHLVECPECKTEVWQSFLGGASQPPVQFETFSSLRHTKELCDRRAGKPPPPRPKKKKGSRKARTKGDEYKSPLKNRNVIR